MNKFRIAIIAMVAAVLVLPAIAENITIGDTTYQNVKWDEATDAYVTFYHRRGVTKVLLSDLPEDLQDRFNYDEDDAKEELAEEAEKKDEEKEQRKYYKTETYREADEAPEVEKDEFYLRSQLGSSLFGPFPSVVGQSFIVDGIKYEMIKFKRKLFTLRSKKTKNVLGPYWMKDYANVVLDGVNYEVVMPETAEKEFRKLHSERKKIRTTQTDMMATQNAKVLENSSGLSSTAKLEEKGSLSSRSKVNQIGLKKKTF